MSDQASNIDFDLQAAWLRRFKSDAENNLRAFALRLQEAMPQRVTIHERRGLFSRHVEIIGVTVQMDQNNYILEIEGGRLRASIAMVVRGVKLHTKIVDPADWFARLSDETKKLTDTAKSFSQSIASFMAT